MANNSVKISYTVSPVTVSRTFEGDVITSMSANVTTSLTANELAVDNITFVLDFTYSTSSGEQNFIANLPYGANVEWINGNTSVTNRYYVKSVKHLSAMKYELYCVSFVGVLENFQWDGMMFTSGIECSVLIDYIMLTATTNGYDIPYRITTSLSTRKFYGYVQAGNCRDALHEIIFTTNITVTRDADGTIVFGELTVGTPTEIPYEKIYSGEKYIDSDPVSLVEVTEHTYSVDATLPWEVVFDNSDGTAVTNYRLVAKKPMATFRYSTGISGQASTASPVTVTITGQGVVEGLPYKHNEIVLRKQNPAAPNGRVLSINNIYCITPSNGENVLNRLYNYYTLARTVEMDVKYNGEVCAGRYSFRDIFGEQQNAYLEKMSMVISSFIKAKLTLVPGYIPPSAGYSTAVLLTGSGTWYIPDGVTQFKVYLVGGGNGGSAGQNGEDGEYGAESFEEEYRADGGAAGTPGDGGYVYEVTLRRTSAITSYQYSCGTGGAGGTRTQAARAGTHTSFGSFRSNSGSRQAAGFYDGITGNTYAKKGDTGFAGGRGGYNAGGTMDWSNLDRWGESVYAAGGIGGSNAARSVAYIDGLEYNFFGGTGGGGAYNSRGGNGEVLSHSGATPDQSTGSGGNGADAGTYANPTQSFGCGGRGGSGGGGGGAAGYAVIGGIDIITAYSLNGGRGGYGGAGGRGEDGCIVIMY